MLTFELFGVVCIYCFVLDSSGFLQKSVTKESVFFFFFVFSEKPKPVAPYGTGEEPDGNKARGKTENETRKDGVKARRGREEMVCPDRGWTDRDGWSLYDGTSSDAARVPLG